MLKPLNIKHQKHWDKMQKTHIIKEHLTAHKITQQSLIFSWWVFNFKIFLTWIMNAVTVVNSHWTASYQRYAVETGYFIFLQKGRYSLQSCLIISDQLWRCAAILVAAVISKWPWNLLEEQCSALSSVDDFICTYIALTIILKKAINQYYHLSGNHVKFKVYITAECS